MAELPVFSVQYTGNIFFYYLLNKYPQIKIERFEYYIKQTLRNRMYILTSNGVMPLIIPVIHKHSKEYIYQKEICYKEKWYKKHYTAIVSAYKKAPYFEHYAEEILGYLIHPEDQYLFEFNIRLIRKILEILNITTQIHFTHHYQNIYPVDYRTYLDAPASLPSTLEKPYLQVFADRFPFHKNLSILDIIFNLGPYAKEYISNEI